MLGFISDLIRLCRVPMMGTIALIPVLGSISTTNYTIIQLIILFIIGMFLNIYLFTSNDIADAELDRMSKLSRDFHARAIAKKTISKKTALFISTISAIIPIVLTFLFFYRQNTSFFLGITVITISFILCTIYNLWGKKFISSAFFASFACGLIVLYGAFMTSDVINIYTWVLFALICIFMLFLISVTGGLKDAGNDIRIVGKTIPLMLGVRINENDKTVKITKGFIAFTLLLEIISITVLFIPYLINDIRYDILQILIIIIINIFAFFFTYKLLKTKIYDINKTTMISVLLMIFVTMIPTFSLFPLIGTIKTLFLVFFPLIWIACLWPVLRFTKKYLPKPLHENNLTS